MKALINGINTRWRHGMGLVALLTVCAAVAAHGTASYYVTTDGLDTADGLTWTTAWRTIPHAVGAAAAEDTIFVSNGVYDCSAEILIDKPLTLLGVNGAAVTIVQRDGSGGNHRVFRITAAGAVLDGLTVRNGSHAGISSDTFSGAGVHMTVAATLRNCVFRNNIATGNALKGGAVYMTAGLVENCEFYDNQAHTAGGAVYLSGNSTVRNGIIIGNYSGNTGGGGVHMNGTGTLLENCLIVSNRAGSAAIISADGRFDRYRYGNRGGGVYNANGTIRNCTILGNRSGSRATGIPGQGLYQTGDDARVINSIIYYNGASLYAADRNDVTLAGGSITYSCVGADIPGDGNTTLDPDFMDWEHGDYTLRPGSPCLDGGTNLLDMATDIIGNSRRIDGHGDGVARQDMGAHETIAADEGPFRVNATASVNEAFDTLDTVLTAHAAGIGAEALGYFWDLNNDGETDATTAHVSHTYGPGMHTIVLTVSNAAWGATAVVKTAYLRVAPSMVYVSTNGANVFPYATPANAAVGTAAGFSDAIAAARVTPAAASRIKVAAGDYPLTAHIVLNKAVTMKSAGGAGETILRRSTTDRYRVLNVLFNGAVADGFTIRDGYTTYHEASGAGVLVMSGGTLQHCIVSDNWANHSSSQGGGGVLVFNGGTVRNCLITQNANHRVGGGVAALDNPASARFETCTIVSNTVLNSTWLGGGTYNGTYQNCIIAHNINTGGDPQFADRHGGTYTYTLSPGLTDGEGNLDAAPAFADPAAADFRLLAFSPGIDAGINQPWMLTARDLDGTPRILNGDPFTPAKPPASHRVDMGAYEYRPPRMGVVLRLR